MSTSITTAFIKQYGADVHHIFQREGGFLRGAVRMRTDVVGSTSVFQKIGAGTATTKARHGSITPMNQAHTAPSATLVDFYAGDWVDRLDQAKTNIDERMALAKGGAWALGRKCDNQIITVLDTTTESTVTITLTNKRTIRAGLLTCIEGLDSNDVPNDGGRYAILSPRLWNQAMTVPSFAEADFVGSNGLKFTEGMPAGQRWKPWNGVLFKSHTDVPGVTTATCASFFWHKNAVGYAAGAHAGNIATNEGVAADITWHGDRASHFVNHMMSGGAVLIDTTGVIQGTHSDSTAIQVVD